MKQEEQLARALMQAYLGSEYENELLSDADLLLRDSVKSALKEKGFSIVASGEVDALKAQVNCLREQLYIIYAAPRSANSFKDLQSYALESLQATPEQCLAEHDARVICSMMNVLDKSTDALSPLEVIYVCDIERYVNKLREQAK